MIPCETELNHRFQWPVFGCSRALKDKGLCVLCLFVVQANVMLEYTLDDADDLLEKNLSAAVKTLAQVDDDLGFLRDQMTTLEVSIL